MKMSQERVRENLYNESYQKAEAFSLSSTKPNEGDFREPSEMSDKCHQSLRAIGNIPDSHLKKSKGKVWLVQPLLAE